MNASTLSRPSLSTARRSRPALFPAGRRTFPILAAEASGQLSPRNRHSLRTVLAAMSPCAAYRLL